MRSILLAVVTVALMAGTVAVITNGSQHRRSAASLELTPSRARPQSRLRPPGFTRRLRAQSRVINGVLSYTPFVALGARRRRAIALTFDDGPSPYTPAIIGVLTRMHVPATFFVVGAQLRYFSRAVVTELARGFEVADHTQNHAWLERLGANAQYAQIDAAATALKRLGARYPRLFRPPYGAYDRHTLAILRKLRMLMVLWSIDPGDWRRPGTRAIVAGVLGNSRPGAIVIMHDGGGERSQTVAALPAIIRGLRRRHYSLVSVPALLTIDPPPRRQRLPSRGAA